ncbi:hypothetical protein pb186bvf_014531 [Paramecium bursaria]
MYKNLKHDQNWRRIIYKAILTSKLSIISRIFFISFFNLFIIIQMCIYLNEQHRQYFLVNHLKTLYLQNFLLRFDYLENILQQYLFLMYYIFLCGKKNFLDYNTKTHQQRAVFGYNIDITYNQNLSRDGQIKNYFNINFFNINHQKSLFFLTGNLNEIKLLQILS